MKHFSPVPLELGTPTFDNVVVEMERPAEKSEGGIIYASQTKDDSKYANSFGRIVRLGPLAYAYTAEGKQRTHRHPSGKAVQSDDYAIFRTYSGQMIEAQHGSDEMEYRVMSARETMHIYEGCVVEKYWEENDNGGQ